MHKTRFGILLLFFGVLSLYSQTSSTNNTVYHKIDAYLKSGIHHGFSGALTIIKNDSIKLQEGYGFANRKQQIPNSATTIYDIGSNTKQFTATAILKLAELGKLKLDDSIALYFKNIPEDKRSITLHQLLTHSSGLIDRMGNDFEKTSTKPFFKQLFLSKLLFRPGKQFHYSNTGYSVLGRVIELVSGTSYESFLQKHLFHPAGMYQTGYLLPKWRNSKLASSYNRGILPSNSPILKYQKDQEISWHLKANGGINSTQTDLALWFKALKTNKILSKKSLNKGTTPYIFYPNSRLQYGYGWTIRTLKTVGKRIAHNGSNGAFAHSLLWYPQQKLYISYITNANSDEVEFLGYRIAKMLLDPEYAPPPIKNNVYATAFRFMEQHPSTASEQLFSLLSNQYPEAYGRSNLLNSLGNLVLRLHKDPTWALSLFKKNTQRFPQDGNLWDSLGDAHQRAQQPHRAIPCYQKAVKLGYTSAKKKLLRLQKNIPDKSQ